mmetsp:Transcript_43559/g.121119  ORF Transcript_43559/g.121119 Transcript_43559/m.121119 type:complete len:298 (-) Transcript_43559:188-1081(-)
MPAFCLAMLWQWVMFRVQQAFAHCLHGGKSQPGYLHRKPESTAELAALVVASQRVSPRALSPSSFVASASACSRPCCKRMSASEHRASRPGFLSGWMSSARRRYAFLMSCPFVSAVGSNPNIWKGRSPGVARMRSTTESTRWAAAASETPGLGGVSLTRGRFTASLGETGEANVGAEGAASSSSSMCTGSSNKLAAASPLVRIAPRTASNMAGSNIRSSCQAWSMRTTSRFSCSLCAFLKVFTATGWTLSANSVLYRPVLSIKRMSSTRCIAWINSQGKHCFAQSTNNNDNCFACRA